MSRDVVQYTHVLYCTIGDGNHVVFPSRTPYFVLIVLAPRGSLLKVKGVFKSPRVFVSLPVLEWYQTTSSSQHRPL